MNLIHSIQAALYERVVSPLAGVFLISWSIMHYDLVMLLFSKNVMFYKTQVIYEVMFIDAQYRWGDWPLIEIAPYWYGLFKPLFVAYIALVSYSLASLPAFYVSSRAKNELLLIKLKFEKETPIPVEKFLAIESKYNEEKKAFRGATIEYEASIESYKKTYQLERNKNLTLGEDIEELKNRNITLLKELDGFKNNKSLIEAEVEENDISKYGRFENEAEEILEKEGLEGTYYSLFFESDEMDLYRSLLYIIPAAEAHSDIKILESLGKPKTKGNIDRVSKALRELALYHLIDDETHFGYELTRVGMKLHDAYKIGMLELEKTCIQLDGV